jgi:hypothetical protein
MSRVSNKAVSISAPFNMPLEIPTIKPGNYQKEISGVKIKMHSYKYETALLQNEQHSETITEGG